MGQMKTILIYLKGLYIFPHLSLINNGIDIHTASTIDRGQGSLNDGKIKISLFEYFSLFHLVSNVLTNLYFL